MKSLISLLLLLLVGSTCSFAPSSTVLGGAIKTPFSFSPLAMNQNNPQEEEQQFGGYTVKQRLREEVESPFRTARLWFFGSSTASAFVALYFSLLALLKSYTGGFADAPPLSDAIQNVGINLGAVAVCGYLTYRDVQAGEANLKRIQKGGALAKLLVLPSTGSKLTPLSTFRRKQRVVICAGGKDYIQQVCRSLNSDERTDTNILPQALYQSEVVVVPVLLEENGKTVGDTTTCWKETTPLETDSNFEISKSKDVVAFPRGNQQWADYLESEVQTATKQGFDVINKGFIIVVKKNGKILKRATGLPPWDSLVNAMEVMDGSKFGMPGDDAKYYTP